MFGNTTKAIASTVALTLALSGAAAAKHPDPTMSVVVHTADLDLTRSENVHRLKRRLNAAAEQICGSTYGMSFSQGSPIMQCQRRVLRPVAGQVEQIIASTPRSVQSEGRSPHAVSAGPKAGA
ncbi:UrcA family protein [Sphingomonas sp. UYP23]